MKFKPTVDEEDNESERNQAGNGKADAVASLWDGADLGGFDTVEDGDPSLGREFRIRSMSLKSMANSRTTGCRPPYHPDAQQEPQTN